MKNPILALTGGIVLLGAIGNNLLGQQVSPDAWGVQVTSANGKFAGAKYYLILTGVGGYTGYQAIGISGIQDSGGTFYYVSGSGGMSPPPQSATNGIPNAGIELDDSRFGTEGLDFSSGGATALGGAFTLHTSTNGNLSGNMWAATGSAPAALTNHSYYLTIADGRAPFASQGRVIFTPSSASEYKVFPTSGGVSASQGTYTYRRTNSAAGFFSLNDEATGSSHEYFGFYTSSNGFYMVAQTSGGFEVGTFSVANLLPSMFFLGQVDLSSNVEWLQFSDGTPFGLYDVMDFGFPCFYHFDMGFEWYFDANDSSQGCYLYDFSGATFFYTDPQLFPFLYDFKLKAWLYYYPDTNNPGHYTSNPRYFYDFGSQKVITK